MDPKETEDNKKRWKKCTEKVYQKIVRIQNNTMV